jgi:hypothetical protein
MAKSGPPKRSKYGHRVVGARMAFGRIMPGPTALLVRTPVDFGREMTRLYGPPGTVD